MASGSRIPAEIMTEILYRLPAKSLGRFRCVSKDWLALISEHKFIKSHQKTLNQYHIIFRSSSWYSLHSHPFHDHYDDAVLTPVTLKLLTLKKSRYVGKLSFCASCHGLLLMMSTAYLFNLYSLVVLNPTTKESVVLPKSPSDNCCVETKIMKGFGYDFLTNDYKVVIISFFYNFGSSTPLADRMRVDVYSLKTNTWRRQEIDFPYYYSNSPSVFVNGFIHWIVEKSCDRSRVVIAFSLATEEFNELSSPNLCNYIDIMSKNDCTLFALGGKLAIFAESEVWSMNEYGKRESWTKIVVHGFDKTWMAKPVILDDYDKIVLANNDMMLIYDVEKRTFSKTVYSGKLNLVVSGTYVESLVSPYYLERHKFSQR